MGGLIKASIFTIALLQLFNSFSVAAIKNTNQSQKYAKAQLEKYVDVVPEPKLSYIITSLYKFDLIPEILGDETMVVSKIYGDVIKKSLYLDSGVEYCVLTGKIDSVDNLFCDEWAVGYDKTNVLNDYFFSIMNPKNNINYKNTDKCVDNKKLLIKKKIKYESAKFLSIDGNVTKVLKLNDEKGNIDLFYKACKNLNLEAYGIMK